MNRRFHKGILFVLTSIFCFGVLAPITPVLAADNIIFVSQARQMALVQNSDITKQYNKIVLKRMKYEEAVKGIHEKMRNLTSFRWSPLFGFHFPEKLTLTEEYELNVKPLVLETEIASLQHALNDMRFTALNNVNQSFIETYICQEKVDFTASLLEAAEIDLKRNEVRMMTGDAVQNDIDTMKKKVKKLTGDLSLQKKNFEIAKKGLTNLIKLDVTWGYTFQNPLVAVDISRERLEEFINYTLWNDQEYYEVKMAETVALLNIDCYEARMNDHYGYKMGRLTPFINRVRNGLDVDYSAFQMQYKEFIKDIDTPWHGYKKIFWFFKFPKEWIKGEVDGTRYIEDEIYALYTASMELAAAKKERASGEKNLRKEIEKSYEAIASAYNVYSAQNELLVTIKQDVGKLMTLNKLGKAEYSEVADKQVDYQELQLSALDALASYNELLFHFDRLTCGAVTKYMNGESLALNAASGGDSFTYFEAVEKPYYYIYTDINKMVFVLGLEIPNDFEPEITHYEVWYEDTRLGLPTLINEQFRHLTLDYGATSMLKIRFYNDSKFVDECDVDTTIARDELKFKDTVQKSVPVKMQIGNYKVETVSYGDFQTSLLTILPNSGINAEYYSLSIEGGTKILTEELQLITQSFSYLTPLISDLETVKLTLYNHKKAVTYHGEFNTKTQAIMADMTQ